MDLLIRNIHQVAGAWKLIYSTITILGSKRTKLGLRDFITLGDFVQIINVAQVFNCITLFLFIGRYHFSSYCVYFCNCLL